MLNVLAAATYTVKTETKDDTSKQLGKFSPLALESIIIGFHLSPFERFIDFEDVPPKKGFHRPDPPC